ncbi:hypothetical protein ACFQHO_49155 [Actinomadura yumaensis]|uniref:hypothetical protein n=1 Tax=Actinomadura yumaensis TaxID=111807 RepID=UPI00360D6933
MARPWLDEMTWSADYFADLLVFVIGYSREHPLLKAALRTAPQNVLPMFTVRADLTIDRVAEIAAPVIQDKIDRGRLPPVDVDILIDLLCRVALSMVFTHSRVDADDPEALRRYLRTAVNFAAYLQPAPTR